MENITHRSPLNKTSSVDMKICEHQCLQQKSCRLLGKTYNPPILVKIYLYSDTNHDAWSIDTLNTHQSEGYFAVMNIKPSNGGDRLME